MKSAVRYLVVAFALLVFFELPSYAAVPGIMTYQGKLSNAAGTPVTGSVNLTFKIYNVASGGTALWTETKSGVAVTNGIFTVALGQTTPIDSSVISSADLWLGVTAGADAEMTPRQKLAIVPYAVRAAGADNVAWSGITNIPASFADNVDADTLGGLSCASGEIAKWNGSVWACAADVDTNTTYTAGTGLMLTGQTFSVAPGGVTSSHIADGTIALADLNQNGCMTDQIMKWNGSAWACAADSSGAVSAPLSLSGANAGAAVISGTNSDITGGSSGLSGISTAASGITLGVYGQSGSTSGIGVLGYSSAASGVNYGVWGQSDSIDGMGLYGRASALSGTTYGVYGQSDSTAGKGLYAWASAASGYTYGVYGVSSSTSGRAVYGWASAASGSTFGVVGSSYSPAGVGVYGENPYGGYAGFFVGDTAVQGNLSVSGTISGDGSGLTGITASAAWGSITGMPAGFSDGVDNGITAETDPTVNALGKATLSCVNGQIAKVSGGLWACGADNDTGTTYSAGQGLVLTGTSFSVANPLSIGGSIQIGSDAAVCQGAKSGTLRWNAATVKIEVCDGVGWNPVVYAPLSLSGTNAGGGVITGTNSDITAYSSGLKGVSTAATGATFGVYGESSSTTGYAVVGYASAASGYTRGVYGWSNSPNGFGVFGQNDNATGYAGYFLGNVSVNNVLTVGGDVNIVGGLTVDKSVVITGSLSAAGGKSFVQPHIKDPAKQINYVAAEAPEAMVLYRGKAKLVNGEATIILPDYFAIVAAVDGILVQATPRSTDTFGLAVVERSRETITVREFKGGKGNFEFDYLVTAVRAGFEAHEPIEPNKDFRPRPDETASEFEARFAGSDLSHTAIRNMLISNGILKADGKVDMAVVGKLGWIFAEEDSNSGGSVALNSSR